MSSSLASSSMVSIRGGLGGAANLKIRVSIRVFSVPCYLQLFLGQACRASVSVLAAFRAGTTPCCVTKNDFLWLGFSLWHFPTKSDSHKHRAGLYWREGRTVAAHEYTSRYRCAPPWSGPNKYQLCTGGCVVLCFNLKPKCVLQTRRDDT